MTSSSHFGYQSNWYSSSEIAKFLKDVQPGDAIEFKRGSYHHWGIYVGEMKVDGETKPCVIHANSPEDANSVNVIASSGSLQKRANNLGMVQLQPIEDAAKGCSIRINNHLDSDYPPLSQKEIIERAFNAIQVYDDYNLFKNNCEHFAHWCRNKVKKSCQVEDFVNTAAKVLAAGVMVIFSIVLGRNVLI